MHPVKNMMVCLDLTDMDDQLIQYSHFLCQFLTDIQKVYFVHNIRIDYIRDAKDLLDKLDRPLGEMVAESIEEKVRATYLNPETGTDYQIIVEESGSTPSILAQLANDQEINLVLAGKKINFAGSGMAVERLLRVVDDDTALLLLPETAQHRIQRILTTTDFSKGSKAAVEKALYLNKYTHADLSCLHVFSFPAFYFPAIKVSDLEPKLRKQAEKEWLEFLKGLQLNKGVKLSCDFSFTWEKNIGDTICEQAEEKKPDLIIIGSRGKGGFTGLVIGSVALQLMKGELETPLLVVKKG